MWILLIMIKKVEYVRYSEFYVEVLQLTNLFEGSGVSGYVYFNHNVRVLEEFSDISTMERRYFSVANNFQFLEC